MRIVVVLLALVACTKAPVQVVDTDETDVEDTDLPDLDVDGDDYLASKDCDDSDPDVNPGEDEVCDGKDNDCDAVVDEDQDADHDGHLPIDICPGGDDCDDANSGRYPGNTEIPYDTIDQDCDGADLVDVDGDTYKAVEAGGSDCNDNDPAINAAAVDIPKDGIDNDCKDGDDLDGDDDGYDDLLFGGTDCDDTDPRVRPGGVDYNFDGVNSDCTGRDGGTVNLEDSPVIITGTSGNQDLFGYDVDACDLDEDGLDDLIISAPFANSYYGRIAIYYGKNSDLWGPALGPTDADAEIKGASEMFFGMGVVCADVDGDGHQDIVTARGEIDYPPSYDTDFTLLFFYGDGTGVASSITDRYADGEMLWVLGVPSGVATVNSRSFTAEDIDGDGAAEVMVNLTAIDTTSTNGVLVGIPGARYEEDGELADYYSWSVGGDSANSIDEMTVVPDLDGDGASELYVGQSGYTTDTSTDPAVPGRASFIDATTATAVADVAWLVADGSDGEAFGSPLAVDDLDGDGVIDFAVGARQYAGSATNAGALYFYSDATVWTGTDFDPNASATSIIACDVEEGYFGWRSTTLGDADGDGVNDLVVGQYDEDGKLRRGHVWLLGGARLATSTTPEEAAILDWKGERPSTVTFANTGSALTAGDFDGDGHPEIVIGAYTYTTLSGKTEVTTGRVYVLPTW